MLPVGDVALVALPGEPFVELGLELKASRAARTAAVVGFANDDVRYVMTDDAYVAGQYETVGTRSTPAAPTRSLPRRAGLAETA